MLAAGLSSPVPPPKPTFFATHTPRSSQVIFDCRTPAEKLPLQPPLGCDDWSKNRFERPFSLSPASLYIPDLDILSAELEHSGDWFYVRISLAGLSDTAAQPQGVYALEIDDDLDGRGDLLFVARFSDKTVNGLWSIDAVQVWEDSDNDVGGLQPGSPDAPTATNGYDRILFTAGGRQKAALAKARYSFNGEINVEIALLEDLLSSPAEFKWWLWAAAELDPGRMDLHDSITSAQAGDPNSQPHPSSSTGLQRIDSTCKGYWPGKDDGDPLLCSQDRFIPIPGRISTQPPTVPAYPFGAAATPSSAVSTATPSASPTPPPTLAPPPQISPTPTRRHVIPSLTPLPTFTPTTPAPTPTNRNCDPEEGCGN